MRYSALATCVAILLAAAGCSSPKTAAVAPMPVPADTTPGFVPNTAPVFRRTSVAIKGTQFLINGQPTYAGVTWNGRPIEGLLFNTRMVQGIFDDRNPATVGRWAYPDTKKWDPERNTREFLAALPEWRKHGVLAFTINLQGGSPEGYSKEQPWHNSAIESDGSLRADYLARLERIIDRADELGMAVILGYFYFGQDERLTSERSVIRATDRATEWVLGKGWRNVLIEINNECNVRYDHEILQPRRVHELIQRVQRVTRDGRHLLVSTSYGGGTIPGSEVVKTADFLLLHGNGVSDPAKITDMVTRTRSIEGYKPKPILFNEDDHFDFQKPVNNLVAAVSAGASWGYFDPGASNYQDGYQSPPVNWAINTQRKKEFFDLVAEVTHTPAPRLSAPRYQHTTIQHLTYKGWTNALLFSNGTVETIVVPEIGRVMQFRFAGDETGPFWDKPQFNGRMPDPKSDQWGNFGGDKTWPSPQGEWPSIIKRGWPPPPAFDSMSVEAKTEGDAIILTSPVDPFYGIRTVRRITLDAEKPVMHISTAYEKVSGEERRVSIWTITQLRDPVLVAAPIKPNTAFATGYTKQSDALPQGLQRTNNLMVMTRSPKDSSKIGMDSESLLWIGANTMVRIDSPRQAAGTYPDEGSSNEVYTNPNPDAYVELELLGPLQTMKVGDRFERANTYTLLKRTKLDPLDEARAQYPAR